MVVIVKGDVGDGKTTIAVYFARILSEDCPVYANFTIKIPNYRKFDMREFFNRLRANKKSLCIIDEAYLEADCRNSMSIQNILESYFTFQHRKMKTKIIYVCQDYYSLDVRLRNRATYIITALPSTKKAFHYEILNVKKRSVSKMKISRKKAEKMLFGYFDTYEIATNQRFELLMNKFMASTDIDGESSKNVKECLKWITEMNFKLNAKNVKHFCYIHNLSHASEFIDLLYTKCLVGK